MTGREKRLVRCLESGIVESKLRRGQMDTTQKMLNMVSLFLLPYGQLV
jgi:hypothetical protein